MPLGRDTLSVMTSFTSTPRRRANAFGGLAVAWGMGLIIVALTVPIYGSQTLIEVNGVAPAFVLLIVAVSPVQLGPR